MALSRPLRSTPGPVSSSTPAGQRIIVALDVATEAEALALVERLGGRVGMFKVGSQLFTAAGPGIVRRLVAMGERVFLDLKFHDIPHVVGAACAQAAEMGVSLVDVHASGGLAMLRAAREALDKVAPHPSPGSGREPRFGDELPGLGAGRRPRLLAVTVLTSLDQRELKAIGWKGTPQQNVLRLGRLAQRAGCDGVVAAPTEIAALRRACGPDFLIVTPGIQLPGHKKMSDQARVATPAAALRAGASYIVLGRALAQSRNPARTLRLLLEDLNQALS